MRRKLTERAAEFDSIDCELARLESRISRLKPKNNVEKTSIYRARRSVAQARHEMRFFLPAWRLAETDQ